MSDAALSTIFWTIFNSLLRDDDSQAAQTRASCTWMMTELPVLRKFCTADEADILGLVYNHWSKYREAPSFQILKHHLQQASNPGLEEHLKSFEQIRDTLPKLTAVDLPAQLGAKTDEFNQNRLDSALRNALVINSSGAEISKKGQKGKIKLKGAEDAMSYLIERVEAGAFGTLSNAVTYTTLEAGADHMWELYQQAQDPTFTGGQRILTGIAPLDRLVKMRKGQFVGLLGYPGSGKTRFGRTIIYNAAMAGLSCLHLTLEQTVDEELVHYGSIHSYNKALWGRDGFPYDSLEDGALSKADASFYKNTILRDLKVHEHMKGHIAVRMPSSGTNWEAVKTFIRIQDRERPIDVVLIDYLANVSPTSSNYGKAKDEMEEIIQDAKILAMTHRGNEGLLLITPVQANREGWEKASKNGGRYESDAIYMYSQFERALDLLLSVYSDDDLTNEDRVVLGIAKYRRGKLFPPIKTAVVYGCGTFRELTNKIADPEGKESSLDCLL